MLEELLRGLEPMAADNLSAALAALCEADHEGELPDLREQAADGYLVIDDGGRIVAMSPTAAHWLHATSASDGTATTFELPEDARHADGSHMPLEEHPGMAALRCGQDFNRIICSVHSIDGELAWLECSSRAVTFGESRNVLVEFRPISWDPAPGSLAVREAMTRVEELRAALRAAG